MGRPKTGRKPIDWEWHRVYCRDYHKRKRDAVLALLGGKCNWPGCSWSDERALQVDHVNGGGTKETRSLGNVRSLYDKILAMKNPELEYQLLCANHNWIKRYENKETSRKKVT